MAAAAPPSAAAPASSAYAVFEPAGRIEGGGGTGGGDGTVYAEDVEVKLSRGPRSHPGLQYVADTTDRDSDRATQTVRQA